LLLEPATAIAAVVALGAWSGYARAFVGAPVLAATLDAGLLALFAIVLVRASWHRPRFTVIDVLIGAYSVLALIEMANPNVPSLTLAAEGFRKTAAMTIGYWIVRVSGSVRLIDFLMASVAGLVPALLMGVRQFFLPWPIDRRLIDGSGVAETTFLQAGQLRAFAPTAGPFHLGAISGYAAIGAAWLGYAVPRRRRIWIGVAVVAGLALLLTITRANWLATLTGLALGAMLVVVATRRVRKVARLAVVVSAIGLALALIVPPLISANPTGDRWLFYFRSLTTPLETRNMQFRLQYWSEYTAAIAERPLTGYGISSAADGFGADYAGTGRRYFPPHSIYFKAALEMGIAGLALLIAILLVAASYGLRLARGQPALAAVVSGTVAFVAISGISGAMLDAYPFNLVFWTMIGFAVNLAHRQAEVRGPLPLESGP
jgi:O-antigen ligase